MLSSYSIVSSSRTIKPCSPWGGRWIGHWRTTQSTVCSSAPHSQAAEEAIFNLCKQERKRPTPVRRRFSRTHAVLGRVIPGSGCQCWGWKYKVSWCYPTTPPSIGDHHCGTREKRSSLQLSGPGLRWLFAAFLLEHPSQSQQAASGPRRRVVSIFCEVNQGVGDTWFTYPTLLRGIWSRSRRAVFRCCCWLLAHVWFLVVKMEGCRHRFCSAEL